MVNGHNLRVAGDDARYLVGEDGVGGVAAPVLHVVAEGDADALGLQTIRRVDASGVVEHEEMDLGQLGGEKVTDPTPDPSPTREGRRGGGPAGCVIGGGSCRAVAAAAPLPCRGGAGGGVSNLIHRALVLGEALPPLGVGVGDREQGLVARLPLVGGGDVLLRPREADGQRLAHGLVAGAVAADVSHPAAALVCALLIAAAPGPVDEGGEAAALVHVPAAVLMAQHPP